MTYTRNGDDLQQNQISVVWVPRDVDHQKLRLSQGVLAYVADAKKICLHDGLTFGGVLCWNGNLTPPAALSIKGIAPITAVKNTVTGEWTISADLCGVPTAPIGSGNVLFCNGAGLFKGPLPVVDVNSIPVAQDDTYSVVNNTLLSGNVALNDVDANGDPLVFTMVTGPSHGTASLAATGLFTYVPNPGYVGTDTFVYQVDDGKGGIDTAVVTINVTASNSPPVAVNDTFTTPYQTTFNGTVATNDSDPNGDTLTFAAATLPSHGTLTMAANGTFTYVPAAGYSGADSFTYTVNDGNGGTATATVAITVGPNTGTLTANNDGPYRFVGFASPPGQLTAMKTLTISPLGNDVDSLGRPFSITAASVLTGNGTVTFTGTQIVFTPTSNVMAPVTISYTITNSAGQTSTAQITGLLGQSRFNSFGNIIVLVEYSDGVLTDGDGNIVTI